MGMRTRGLLTVSFVNTIVLGIFLVGLARAAMPLPASTQSIPYTAVESPVLNDVAANAMPIGVGTASTDHNLSLQVGLNAFSGSVDMYLAIYAPAVLPTILLFDASGGFIPITDGFPTWKSSVTGSVSESLLGTIPLSLLPSGDYAFFLMVVPAGTPLSSIGGKYYLWMTTVGNLRAQDVTNIAISSFGGDTKAAASILTALARGYSLPETVDAIMAGTLSDLGEISGRSGEKTKAFYAHTKELPDFCKDLDPAKCNLFFAQLSNDYLAAIANDENWGRTDFDRLVTTLVLWASNRGYSVSQIHEGVYGMLTGTWPKFQYDNVRFTFTLYDVCTGEEPEGTCEDGEKGVQPKVDPADLFSDLDPGDFDSGGNSGGGSGGNGDGLAVPGTEGMTFPTFYKGSGTYWHYLSLPKYPYGGLTQSGECSTSDAVYVAAVYENRITLYWADYTYARSGAGEITCQDAGYSTFINKFMTLDNSGTYHADSSTEYGSGTTDIFFNKDQFWGNAWWSESKPVYQGDQVTQKQWDFNLYKATEDEYKAVIGQQ